MQGKSATDLRVLTTRPNGRGMANRGGPRNYAPSHGRQTLTCITAALGADLPTSRAALEHYFRRGLVRLLPDRFDFTRNFPFHSLAAFITLAVFGFLFLPSAKFCKLDTSRVMTSG
jgi:hypothetical protein